VVDGHPPGTVNSPLIWVTRRSISFLILVLANALAAGHQHLHVADALAQLRVAARALRRARSRCGTPLE
jgi:hypothetical protein